MKAAKLLSLITLVLLISTVPVTAQDNGDGESLQRDIRVAEGILSGLFDEQDLLPHRSMEMVRGQYISGYGIHFTIHPALHAQNIHEISVHSDSNPAQIHIQVDDEESKRKVRSEEMEEDIQNRMIDYFTTYAPLLKGLDDHEVIRITYGINPQGSGVARYFYASLTNGNEEPFPAFSMWAEMADIKAFHQGEMSEREFRNRIRRYDFSEKETATDLEIFASVLETALQNTDTEYLQFRRKPTVDHLPGLGAHYQIQVHKGGGFFFGETGQGDFELNLDSFYDNFESSSNDSFRIHIPKFDFTLDSLRFSFSNSTGDSLHRSTRKYVEEMRNHAWQMRSNDTLAGSISSFYQFDTSDTETEPGKLNEEMEGTIRQIKEMISQYGSTLTSLADDEFLLITINWGIWGGRTEKPLPAQTEIRIKKSDLLHGREPEVKEIQRR